MARSINSNTGNKLKTARVNAGYQSAKDFYDKFNIKPSTYSAHESGRNPLSMKTATYYAKLLNVSALWLLSEEDEQQDTLDKYVLHYGQVPRDLLLTKMLNEATAQYIKSAGIEKGMTAIELACGTGSMSCWLAEYVGSNGFVYAIDKGYEQLTATKNRASKLQINNIECIRTDISKDPIKVKGDLVYMRCVLHHVKNPQEVIEKAIDLLPKGGILVCMEPIMTSFWAYPSIPEMQKAINLYMKLGEKRGLDFNIGEKLYQHLFNTNKLKGFNAHVHQGTGINKDEKSWIEMITSECAATYVEEKMILEDEMDQMMTNINNFFEREDTIATLPAFVCIAAKKR